MGLRWLVGFGLDLIHCIRRSATGAVGGKLRKYTLTFHAVNNAQESSYYTDIFSSVITRPPSTSAGAVFRSFIQCRMLPYTWLPASLSFASQTGHSPGAFAVAETSS